MTCLVAFRGHDATIVGTDSQWSAGSQKGEITGKMWRNGRWVIAMAGGVRTMQLLQYGPQFKTGIPDVEIVPYLVREWIPSIFTLLNEAGQFKKEDDKLLMMDAEGLIVSPKTIIRFGGDLSVIQEKLRYAAGGSGEEIALGYMAGMGIAERRAYSARTIALGALKASARHNSGVSAPFHLEVVR